MRINIFSIKFAGIKSHDYEISLFYLPDLLSDNILLVSRGKKNQRTGMLSWYYKSVGKEKDYQYQVFRPGETRENPDCIVINLWDYDDCWSVEWLEDGKAMGSMKKVKEYSPVHIAELTAAYSRTGNKIPDYRQTIASDHYFAAKPSENAKTVTILIKDRFGNEWKEVIEL